MAICTDANDQTQFYPNYETLFFTAALKKITHFERPLKIALTRDHLAVNSYHL